MDSSNPAFGLYTTFTFKFRTITRIPEGGSFQVALQPAAVFGLTQWICNETLSANTVKEGSIALRSFQ